MSRRYPTADFYEEQERDFYARPRHERNHEELDIDIRRERDYERRPARADTIAANRRPQRREPDFLREDYGQTTAGALVVADREYEIERDQRRTEASQVDSRRGDPPRPPPSVKGEMVILERSRDNFSDAGRSRRGGRGGRERVERNETDRRERKDDGRSDNRDPRRDRGRYREYDEEELIIRRSDREADGHGAQVRERDLEETDLSFRQGRSQPAKRRERDHETEIDKEEITYRRGGDDSEWMPPRRPRGGSDDSDPSSSGGGGGGRAGRGGREESGWMPPRRERDVEREEVIVRKDVRDGPRKDFEYQEREIDREKITMHERDRSLPPPSRSKSLIARAHEEYVFRRREPSPPPRPPPEIEREQMIIRRRERSLSPLPPPPPSQRDFEKEEIIIRRREREPPREPIPEPESEPEPLREPSPPPLPPIYRPPIIQEIITHHRHIDHGVERARSPTPPPPPPPSPPPPLPPPPVREEDLEIEIRRRGVRNGHDFYEKDIVYERERDTHVPPPQFPPPIAVREEELQITHQRSVSAHRSRRGDNRRDSGRQLRRDMWTELAKDLVLKEAILEMGYSYQETDNFFYVIEYLQYEDVLRLVELTEDIRRERKERLREIAREQEEAERLSRVAIPPPPIGLRADDRTVYERDYIHEYRRGGGNRHR